MKNITIFRSKIINTFLFCIVFSSIIPAFVKNASAQPYPATFRVDMTQQYMLGLFDPIVDSVDMPGSINGWAGSVAMQREGFSLVYSLTYTTLDPNSTIEFRFRFRGEMTSMETPNCGPNRMYLVPNHADTTSYIWSDYQPGTVPVTFKCHMSVQIKMNNFNKTDDYLNIAASINNYGGYDVLYDRSTDSTYEICFNVDTSMVSNQTPIEYKYRINGDTATEELKGQPNRIARVQDTAGGHQNIYEVWYNDVDPSVPAPPVASNVSIQGDLKVGHTLTGAYTYEDINGDPEGASIYRWFRADSVSQVVPDTIPGESTINYLLAAADSGKYIAFEVTPVSNSTTLPVGSPVRGWSTTKVIHPLGINDTRNRSVSLYPNPVNDLLTIKGMSGIQRIEIFSLVGQKVYSGDNIVSSDITLNLKVLEAGVYFIKFYGSDHGYLTSKFIKN
jgi:hypothetical protein